MKSQIITIAVSIVLFFVFVSCQDRGGASPSYEGEWESLAAEDLGNGTYGTRYFNLTTDQWEVKFTLYLDAEQTLPVFEFRGVGPYEVEGPSAVVEGADKAIFHFDRKYITLKTDDQTVINNFGLGACGLTQDVEKDITVDGCSFLPSKTACAQEYDLIQLKEGQLYFGMRPEQGDMCEEARRPTALYYPLKRK